MNPYGMNSPFGNPSAQSRMIIPQIPDTTSNQNIMFMLASGTGGFVIHETNDLIGGMEKIEKEQDEYYVLGYTPPDSEEGSCHTLRVKVERTGTDVRARTGYCNSRPQDLLAGNATEKDLETRAAAAQAGNVGVTMELPYFYTAPNVARCRWMLRRHRHSDATFPLQRRSAKRVWRMMLERSAEKWEWCSGAIKLRGK